MYILVFIIWFAFFGVLFSRFFISVDKNLRKIADSLEKLEKNNGKL